MRLRRRREKVFGAGRALPLDRNAKARIWAFAQAYSARHRRKGQHLGPLTRAIMDVLRALLWTFHNAKTGRCFPGYDTLAAAARVTRATVARAIKALEVAGVLTGQNRLWRRTVPGGWLPARTSNAYQLRDPAPESQKLPRTKLQDFTYFPQASSDPNSPVERALRRFGKAMEARRDATTAPQSGGSDS